MRSVTFILLVVLAFAVLGPMNVFKPMIVSDGHSFIGNLDVCHSATPALSANAEMPGVNPDYCSTPPTLFISFSKPVHDVYVELLLASRDDQPPKS